MIHILCKNLFSDIYIKADETAEARSEKWQKREQKRKNLFARNLAASTGEVGMTRRVATEGIVQIGSTIPIGGGSNSGNDIPGGTAGV